MKKFLALLLAAIMVFALAACEKDTLKGKDSNDKGSVADTQKPNKDDDEGKDRNYLADPGVTYDAGGLAITFTKLEKIESSETIGYGPVTETIDTSEYRLHYRITNTSDAQKTFYVNAFTVNGITVDEAIWEVIAAGKMIENYASFFWFDFDHVQIDDIKNIKCPTAKIYVGGQEPAINVDIELDCGDMGYTESVNLSGKPVYNANSVEMYVVDIERMSEISRTAVTIAVVNKGNSFAKITADSFIGNGTAVDKFAKHCAIHAGCIAFMEVEWSDSEVDSLGGYLENFSFVAHSEDDNGVVIDGGTKVTVELD